MLADGSVLSWMACGAVGGPVLGRRALIGGKFGGPVGALIGGPIGFGAGTARLLIKSAAEKVQEKVKSLYGVSIPKSMAQQIVLIANDKYGKNLDMAVRSAEVRDLLKLYAQTMGQKVPPSLMAGQPHSASLIESRGHLFQGPTYDTLQAYTFASSLGTYGGVSSDRLSTSGPSAAGPVVVNLNQQQTVDLWRTGTTQAIQGNPRGVAQSAYRGSAASNTRADSSVLILAPGVIVQ